MEVDVPWARPIFQGYDGWLESPFGPLNTLHERLLAAQPFDNTAGALWVAATIPMAGMAYLLPREGSWPIRAALGAHGLAMITHAWLSYRVTDQSLSALNAAITLLYLFLGMRYLEWMCLEGPVIDPRLLSSASIRAHFVSMVDLCCNYRLVGLGSVGLDDTLGRPNLALKRPYHSPAHPTPWPSTTRPRAVGRHIWAAAWRYLVADGIGMIQRLGKDSIAKSGGRSGAMDAWRVQAQTWAVHRAGGVMGIVVGAAAWVFALALIPAAASLLIAAAYHAFAAVATATIWEPDAWDTPMFDDWVCATSLNEFWGRRWHQIIRHYMVVLSTLVSRLLPSPVRTRALQMTLVFAFSALLHVLAHLSLSPVPSPAAIGGFFLASGAGVVLERAFKKVTGKRVCGTAGWVWTWAFLSATGWCAAEAWIDAGFAVVFARVPSVLGLVGEYIVGV